MIDLSIPSREDAHTSGAYPKRPLALVRGEGSYVWDDAGRSYLDVTSGQGVTLLGHSHPAIVQAISQQAQTLMTCPEIFYNDQRALLYDTLGDITPADLKRFFLCNSGAEATEGALKVARLLTGREGVVATVRGFHGRTVGALSLTWNKQYREPFTPWLLPTTHIPYDNLETARHAITSETAAVVVEVVQGEGGVYSASSDYLQGLRTLCDAVGALLIVDEIQTFARTGTWFAFEQAGIVPDIVTLAKGIGGGVPMGVVCWRASLGELPRGSHGSTFGGNPLACAAAIATLQTLIDLDLPQRAAGLGQWLIDELAALGLVEVREIRGRGLMIGLELRGRVTPVLKTLQDEGVLALPAGLNVLRLLPPLTISQAELGVVVNAIQRVLA